MSFSIASSGDVPFISLNAFAARGYLAAFSTRQGGVSEEPFASMNLGFSSGDLPENVIRNRRRFFGALGIDPSEVVVASQVHGNGVLRLTAEASGMGATSPGEGPGPADILLTDAARLFLFQIFADCVPIFLADSRRRAVAIAHAGWRGSAADVAGTAVRALGEAFGSAPGDLVAGIGPAIAPPCYPVGPEVGEAITATYPWAERYVKDGQADLRSVNAEALLRLGIPTAAIHIAPWCTRCETDLLFSYRRDGVRSGRMAGIVGIL